MLDVHAICRLFQVAGYSDERLFGHIALSPLSIQVSVGYACMNHEYYVNG
jgi:hypothetical protein